MKKKFFALILAFTMMMTMVVAVPVSAATGSITINVANNIHTLEGFRFDAYKIFDLDSFLPGSFPYVINPAFADFDNYPGGTDTPPVPLDVYIRTLNSHSDEMNELAANLWEYILAEGIGSKGDVTGLAGDLSVEISPLELGYYLVYGTGVVDGNVIVAACGLTTTDPDADIFIKADVPELDKYIDDPLDDDLKETDLKIGDIVKFRLESAVPVMTGYESYTFTVHDKMSVGLTYIIYDEGTPSEAHSVKVTVNGVVYDKYEVYSPAGDGCTLDIVFDPVEFVKLTPGEKIVITYEAMLNENAVIGAPGNKNTANLEFSRDPYTDGKGKTPDTETKIYTFRISILKHDDGGKGGPRPLKYLGDAKFILCTDDDEATAIPLILVSTGTGPWLPSIYRVATPDEILDGTDIKYEFVTPESGLVWINGLDAGDYYLFETEAPPGYNKMEGSLKITIVHLGDGDYEVNGLRPGTPIQIENTAGLRFPDTGGIGTVIFTVTGALLMAGAALMLFIRRRRSSAKV